MKIEDLQSDIDNYKKSLIKISEKRELWSKETRLLLETTLKEIKAKFDFDWTVQSFALASNMGTVNLTFNNSPSGIVEKNEQSKTSYFKKSGTLSFSQAYNGTIFVFITLPEVENFVTNQNPTKLIEKIDPEKIDDSYIISKASEFLKAITKWEESDSSLAPVGYSNYN